MGDKTGLNTRPKKIFLTLQGLEELRFELNFLKFHKRLEIAKRLQDARDLDDTEENAEYDAAMVDQELMENRIAELEQVLRDAKIIKSATSGGIVSLGSTVVIQIKDKLDQFTIVGKMEANPTKKKISNESPIGLALLGAKIGDKVEVATPITKYSAKVIEIK